MSIKLCQAMSMSSDDSPLYAINELSSGYESFILFKKGEEKMFNEIYL